MLWAGLQSACQTEGHPLGSGIRAQESSGERGRQWLII